MLDDNVDNLIQQLKTVQLDFFNTFQIRDIITNSKIFEILIADSLGHDLIPGHSGSRDAKNEVGQEYEYKHYKESSSNHTWTFNDFSETTIKKLHTVKSVIFAHIQDEGIRFPVFDWYYEVPGNIIADYLENATQKITNNRKMINVGTKQIKEKMGVAKEIATPTVNGKYTRWIKKIIEIAEKIENVTGTSDILTSNKFWEVLVAQKLGHKVQSEQAKHDAEDNAGNYYEYKVGKGSSWSFQDISPDVLKKYLKDKNIILATVDKDEIEVKKIYVANTKKVVSLLKKKLGEKEARYKNKNKGIRRKQASLSAKDLREIKAQIVFPF